MDTYVHIHTFVHTCLCIQTYIHAYIHSIFLLFLFLEETEDQRSYEYTNRHDMKILATDLEPKTYFSESVGEAPLQRPLMP